jgi:hypothetical protein
MIAHVAEASEGRGRVVLSLGPSSRMSEVAVSAALRVAAAFQSEVEALFVEDHQLFDLARFPFAREIALTGRTARPLSPDDIARELRQLFSALQRRVVALAREAEIACRCRTVRDEPVHALATACAENGPWNVVALSEPLTGKEAPLLARLFAEVHGTTGLIVAGSRSRRASGPVVAVIEDLERLQPMLRTAERLASAEGEAKLLLVGESEEHLGWMEGQARLALEEMTGAALLSAVAGPGEAGPVVRALTLAGAGFAVARFGGRLASEGSDLLLLAERLEGPLLLVR